GGHEGVGGERAAGWIDRDVVAEAERLPQDELLVREGRVKLGDVDLALSDAGLFTGQARGGADREIARAERGGLDAMIDAANECGTLHERACLVPGGEHDGDGAVGDGR